jgi:site-specific DNA-methyltransferase (adenine-specific)
LSWKDLFPKENRYFETENGVLYCNEAVEQLKKIPSESIDLVVTSPPYDDLRTYGEILDKAWNFEVFKKLAKELSRVLKKGGVIVWIVGDATINGSETGSSFQQALYFKDECGLNLHDTMIYAKKNYIPLNHNRYEQQFEYMFVFSKGKPKTFNPIKMPTKKYGVKRSYSYVSASTYEKKTAFRSGMNRVSEVKKEKIKPNIWFYSVGRNHSSKDKIAFQHPAIFPEQLAYDHIISWSNEHDVVLDPLCGSGTTLKMAEKLGRRWIGIEIKEEYCEIAKQRIENLMPLLNINTRIEKEKSEDEVENE